MTITSRDIINEANRRYRAGFIGDDEYLRVVNPYASGQARFLLDLLKRERSPNPADVIDVEYRVSVDEDSMPKEAIDG